MVQNRVKDTEENFLQYLLRHQNKAKILFPYNFKWVLLSCAYSVSLTRGYSNVIDELCVRRFHFILLEIKLDGGAVTILDPSRKDPQEYADMTAMLQR